MLIETLALNSHLDSSYIEKNFENKPLLDLEEYLWSILKGKKVLKNLDGVEKFNDLVKRIYKSKNKDNIKN